MATFNDERFFVKLSKGYACASALLLASTPALAAEPGVANNYPPGATLGAAVGFAKPPGEYLSLASTLYDSDGYDASGHKTGTSSTSYTLTPTLIWSTGWTLLGGHYFLTAIQPIVDLHVQKPSTTMYAKGLANPYISPANISWNILPELAVAAGGGVYLPSGSTVIRNDFWTYEAQLAASYMKDGWSFSVHALYDINSASVKTKYRTGDRLYLDLTATKKISDWKLGPVAYVVWQTSADRNGGIFYGLSAPVFGREQRVAAGGFIGHDFGPFALNGFVTHEIYARSGAGGTRLRLILDVPIGANML